MEMKELEVYDIETYPNIFTLAIGNMGTRKMKVFEISTRKDNRKEMIQYLREIRRNGCSMVGFNNVGFDYPVLHYILKNQQCSVMDIYQKAMSVIASDNMFANVISDKETMIPQIDLYKIHHFDNKARSTSLKMLEFNMRMRGIEDLPYPVGSWLSDEQMTVLRTYNKYDVKATADFLFESMEQVDFREVLSLRYKRNFMNFNDTKIGKDYFITELEKTNKGCCYDRSSGRRVIRQTKRPEINLGECVFDYVHFDMPEFDAIKNWLMSRIITETKGVFSDILESELGDVAKYANMKTKRKKFPSKPADSVVNELLIQNPSGWLSEETLKIGKISYWWNWNVAESLNVNIRGLEYVFGVGGIHASVESQIIRADDDYIVVDQDVSSYYPNLAIKNRIYPEHLGETFCDIYEDMYNQRKGFGKKTAENAMLKLALNGSYGASNDQFSPLYDPMFMMKITINGQLSLCMLAEKLLKIDNLTIIQCNTDGLTYRCKKDDDEIAQKVCDDWEKVTKLELERADYSMMAIRDVNNYIAVTLDGKPKNKGAYEWQNLGWNKNHSNLIIGQAVEECLVNGVPVEETIRSHTDPFDFMARSKVPRSSSLVLVKEDGTEQQLQNICRYYVSKTGGSMVKIMPPLDKGKLVWDCIDPDGNVERVETRQKMGVRSKREGWTVNEIELPPEKRRIGINVGQKVKPCNNMDDFIGFEDIDYDWYIAEAEKLVALNGNSSEENSEDD